MISKMNDSYEPALFTEPKQHNLETNFSYKLTVCQFALADRENFICNQNEIQPTQMNQN